MSPFDTVLRTFLGHISGFALVLTLVGTLGLQFLQRESSSLLSTGLLLAVLVVAALVVVVAAAFLLTAQLVAAARRPTIRLRATGQEPTLKTLPDGCTHWAFASHVWSSGQDQVHTLVRQLQLLLPGIEIWLDVDCLEDMGDESLEKSVASSASVLIFLSHGCTRRDSNNSLVHKICCSAIYFLAVQTSSRRTVDAS